MEAEMKKVEIKRSEIEHVVIRMENAKQRFVAAAMELGKVEREVAEHAMAAFLAEKIIKIDAVGGQMIVKSGQVYDHDILVAWAAEAKFMGLV